MSEENWQGFPVITPSQYVMVQVEASTGIVLDTDGHRSIKDVGERYIIFDSFEELEIFTHATIASHPHVEYVVLDYRGKSIQVIRNISSITTNAQKLLSPWWRFW